MPYINFNVNSLFISILNVYYMHTLHLALHVCNFKPVNTKILEWPEIRANFSLMVEKNKTSPWRKHCKNEIFPQNFLRIFQFSSLKIPKIYAIPRFIVIHKHLDWLLLKLFFQYSSLSFFRTTLNYTYEVQVWLLCMMCKCASVHGV